MTAVPDSLAAVDPDWLTRVLRQTGSLAAARVTAVTCQPIGAEVGFLDTLARLVLTYDRPDGAGPASLVAKLSATDAAYRAIADRYDAYEREFRFYEAVAPAAPIRLPRCYGRAADPATGAHLLLLEDLGGLIPGDQVAGLTPVQAGAAVEAIGRFHAAWWGATGLDELAWLPRRNIRPDRYRAAWPGFRAGPGRHLPPPAVALGDRLAADLDGLLTALEGPPHTIAHSDFRADNLLFDRPDGPHPVVVLDWQLAVRGSGVLDVARLLCGSLAPRDRAAGEGDLVRRWHAALAAGGVRGYPVERALEGYRTAARVCLYYPVTIAAAEAAAGPRGAALARAQVDRFFAAAVELGESPTL